MYGYDKCTKLGNFIWKLWTLDVLIVWICKNLNSTDTLNVKNCVNPDGYCVQQMYRSSRFVENLNLVNMMDAQNCTNSMGNYVHYMDGLFGFAENFSI